MKTLNSDEMRELIKQHPEGGIIFEIDNLGSEMPIMVTKGISRVVLLAPFHGDIFVEKWTVEEGQWFHVYEEKDILLMIQMLTKSLNLGFREVTYEG